MQNKKCATYIKALLTSGMFYVGIIVGAIALVLFGICDKFGYVDVFTTTSKNLAIPMIGLLACGVLVYAIGAFVKANSKTVCITESFIGLTVATLIGFICLAFTTSIGVDRGIILAVVSLILAVLAVILRVKNYSASAKAETLEANATFATYYKNFFKKYGIVSIIFAVLAIASVVLLERANIISFVINGNSLKIVAIIALVSIALLLALLVVTRVKSKEIGIVDVVTFMALGGTIGLIPVTFMVGDVFRALAFVILAVAIVVVIALTVLLVKNTHIYTVEEEDAIEYGKNGIVSYFKALSKKANVLAMLGIAVVATAVVVFAEGIKLVGLLINVLNLSDVTILAVIVFAVMVFVALFVIADIKDHRITSVDPALCVWTLSFILMLICDFALLGGEVGIKFYVLLAGTVIGIALTLVRSIFVKLLDEETEKVIDAQPETTAVETVAQEEPIEEKTEEAKEESVETVVQETVEEPVEAVAEETTVVEETQPVQEDTELAVTEEPVKLKRVNSKKTIEIYLRTGDDQLKENYSALKNAFYSYGVHSRLTKTRENFSKKGASMSKVKPEKPLHLQAKLLVRGKFVKLFINLDPTTLDAKYFRHSDVSKKYPDQATLVKVRSKLSLKRAIELIDKLAVQEGYTKKKKFVPVDYKAELTDENLSYMQKLGFDYMVKDSVTLDEVKAYNDEFAKKLLKTEVIAKPERYIYDEITLDALSDNFADGEVADLEAMRVKGIIKINANSVTVKPSATLSKKLIVVANVIDPKAAEMIAIAGGEATQLIEG